MQRPVFDRRAFLKSAAALSGGLGGLGLTPVLGSAQPRSRALPFASGLARLEHQTKHVVLIAFAGGVRTRETFGTPANVPNLKAMAEGGVLYPRTRTSNLGHFGAALSIFTGVGAARGIRENVRGPEPTLFEYIRKGTGLAAGDVWISTSGGAQQTNYSYGLNPEYGPPFGANTLDGDGIFNAEFQEILSAYGKPRDMAEPERAALDRMRRAVGSGREQASDGGSALNDAASAARVENYILDELSRGTSDIRGANAADAKALRVARNLLTIFKPRLVSVVLQQADIAHGSYNGYVEVIRRNDAAIGELWSAVQADAELAESTAFIVLPEFGRDADLNSRRGLDHGDGSDDLNYVTTVCWGPDFKRGHVSQQEVGAVDVCPTVCDLFGVDAHRSRGKRLPGLFA